MLLVGLAALLASMAWGAYAILPRSKGRRKRSLRRAAVGLIVFAMYWATQWSVTNAFVFQGWTPRPLVFFALPVVVMLAGLVASVVFGIRAVLRKTGTERRKMVLQSLLGVIVFGVGIAPHAAAMLMPILAVEGHSNRPGTLTRVGDPVPDFAIAAFDGTPFHSADLRGHVIVLNFFATWCGPCQLELPHLQAIWDEFQGNGDFRMLVVGREESDDIVKAFQTKHGFTFPMASDPDRSVYDKFAAQSIPRTYLISRQGTIIYQSTGYYEREVARLRKLLRKELAKNN